MSDCLGCQRCEIATVTLRDGRVVCDHCEDWRHECETREVANMATNEARAEHLAGVERKRGKPAADRLRADAWKVMQG